MNNYEDELRQKWDAITYHYGGALQLAIEHPLEWYVGYFMPEHKSIVIICDVPVKKIGSSKSIEASCNLRKDGNYAVTFTLISQEQEDVFVTMCDDIIWYSHNEKDRKHAMIKVLERYSAWLKLLERKNKALLGSREQKGLIGELIFLKNIIEDGMSIQVALNGWVGPDGADQDFVYSDEWYEIKSVGISATEISISSLEQLDKSEKGELVVMRVNRCAPEQKGAFTLYKLVHQLLSLINGNPECVEDFILKLGSVGYIDMLEYDEQYYAYYGEKAYSVEKDFPRLTRNCVPSELSNAEYKLVIATLEKWSK